MILTAIWLRLIPFVLLLSAANLHPYFVSIYQITHNKEEHTLQITAKLFTSDLEKALQEHGAPDLHLGSDEEYPGADSLINVYLKRNFHLRVDGEPVQLRFLGKEVGLDQVTWCYLEVDNIEGLNKVFVRNTALFEVDPSQTNMIHVEQGDVVKNMLLRKPHPEDEVSFE